MNYVTVMSAHPRSGWMVAKRDGSIITYTRLGAQKYDPDTARAEAEARFPSHRVYMAGDPNPPWKS